MSLKTDQTAAQAEVQRTTKEAQVSRLAHFQTFQQAAAALGQMQDQAANGVTALEQIIALDDTESFWTASEQAEARALLNDVVTRDNRFDALGARIVALNTTT